MGLKKFTNSPNGRVAIALSSLILVGLLMAGGLYAYITIYPQSLKDSFEGQLKQEATSWPIHDLKLSAEEAPLPELPSTTISYVADESDSNATNTKVSNHPVGFPFMVLSNKQLDSLINVSATYEDESATGKGANYSFKFYSSSLKDYDEGGDYYLAAEQFFLAHGMGLGRIDFVSKPSASGGREVTINAQTAYAIDASKIDATELLWNNLVRGLSNESAFESGTLINLTLSDPQAVSVKTTLTSAADAEAATTFYPGLWTTFAAYAYGDAFSYLKVSKVEYTVERTPEDSTLVVTVDKETPAVNNVRQRIIDTSLDSEGVITVLWSYNTYYVTAENQNPFLVFGSTSRNW